MWYAVETAFIDGKHFASIPLFKMDADPNAKYAQPGTTPNSHDECPHNSSQKCLKGRIEIHIDWFQTKEQAMKFCDGTLTYIVHMIDHYRKDIRTIIPDFYKWETVELADDMEPFRGIYKHHKPLSMSLK